MTKNRIHGGLSFVLVLGSGVGIWAACATPRVRAPAGEANEVAEGARVEPLRAPRLGSHAYGRTGDLVLHGTEGTSLTIAASLDAPGHRPLRGALLDIAVDESDAPDPFLWWRSGWLDAQEHMHVLLATKVSSVACAKNSEGIRAEGEIDGVGITSDWCAHKSGYGVTTTARGLPAGAHLADELHPGTALPVIDGQGGEWDGEFPTRFVAIAEHGIAASVEMKDARVRRTRIKIAEELFPSAATVIYQGAVATRTLHILRGDVLDAIARLPFATRKVTVGIKDGRAGFVSIRGPAGRELAAGILPAGAARLLMLPDGFGDACDVRDDSGVPGPRAKIAGLTPPAAIVAIPSATVALHFTDCNGAPLATHVIVHGLENTPDPDVRAVGRAFGAGPSVYLLDGHGTIHLAPGHYALTATHGPTHTLVQERLDLEEGATRTVQGVVRAVVDTGDWIAGDFHLHAEPSPDAPVSLEQRLGTLTSEGIDLAVATDHNRLTDYGPTARRLGITSLETVVGDEITSGGARLWGHFIAFPLAPPTGAPEDSAIAYYDVPPGDVFAHARDAGARVVQVNHVRMPPKIGYFEQTHLDAATGHADPIFSDDFDALEAFNGVWIEQPERVREGARDLVAMARRGKRPTATGNSDSHRLLYEEAGYPRTYVHAPRDPTAGRTERTVRGLLAGDVTLSSGPFVELTVQGVHAGSVVRPDRDGHVHAHVRVSAPAWVPVEHVELWVDDTVAARFDVGPARDGLRFERDVDLPIRADAVVLAWADATTPLPYVMPYSNARAIGFTGLVYVDANGDGTVKVPPR